MFTIISGSKVVLQSHFLTKLVRENSEGPKLVKQVKKEKYFTSMASAYSRETDLNETEHTTELKDSS
jgi:hypothetical protein